jgi:hypothetical protein
VLWIEAGQERIRIGSKRFTAGGMDRILLGRRAERDERSVDIEKQQWTLRRASHSSTIATDHHGDRLDHGSWFAMSLARPCGRVGRLVGMREGVAG